jgi:hypothetical protein
MKIPVSEIANALSNAFAKVVGAVKRNGVLISTWAVLLFIILYTFIINPININEFIKENHNQMEAQHNENVEKRLLCDQMIPMILENVRIKFDLDRVCLLEMHNSTQNMNGVSFLYLSMIYEEVADSVDYITDAYQYQRTGNFYEVFTEMKRDGYVILNDMDNVKDPKYSRITKRMIKNGTHSAMFIPIFNQNMRIDAVLVLSSSKDIINSKEIGAGIAIPVEEIKKLIL